MLLRNLLNKDEFIVYNYRENDDLGIAKISQGMLQYKPRYYGNNANT